MSSIVSFPDPVTWNNNANYIWMRIHNMDVGFHLPTGLFAYLPGILRQALSEPAVFTMVHPWFYRNEQGDRFKTMWATTIDDYEAEDGGNWDGALTFGWVHEFDVYPAPGNDVLIKNYIQLRPDHRSFRYITKVTPYYDLDNIGIEYVILPNPTYINRITGVWIEKDDRSGQILDLAQVKDIRVDIPDSLLKVGLVYTYQGESRVLSILDQENWSWETAVLQTEQMTIGGSDRWVVRIGGADTTTSHPVEANHEMVF